MNQVRDLFPGTDSRQVTQLELGSGPLDYAGNFIRSGISSIPELFGMPPLPGVSNYRQDSPIGGFMSQLAGFTVPYLGWYKAARAIRPFEQMISKVGDLNKAPFLTGASREALRFAPFEAGRVGVSQVIGEESFGSMVGDAALNLAIGSGVSGVLHGLASAGRAATAKTHLPGVEVAAPLQIQLRQTKKLIEEGGLTEDLVSRGNMRARELDLEIRNESVNKARGQKYVAPIEGQETKHLTQTFNRLMDAEGDARTLVRRKFIEAARGFRGEQSWQQVAKESGLPDNFTELGQFFRHISFRKADEAKAIKEASNIDRALASRMESIGDNWFLAREQDGLYVMARKTQGTPGAASPDDAWVVFKTDTPGAFAEKAAKWNDIVIAKEAWTPAMKMDQIDSGIIDQTLKGFLNKFPLHNWDTIQAAAKGGHLGKLLPKTDNAAVQGVQNAFREFLSPTIRQFMKNARGRWIYSAARATFDAAETKAQELVYGRQVVGGRAPLWMATRDNRDFGSDESIRALIDRLSDQDVTDLHKVWRQRVDPKEYANLALKGEISPEAARFAEKLNEIDGMVWNEVAKAMRAAGEDPKRALRGHLGLSRSWEGDLRIAIRDESGALVHMAAGPNRRAAQRQADKVLEENPTWQKAEEFSLTDLSSIPKEMNTGVISPSFILERQNVGGFRWQNEPWTRSELLEAYSQGIRGRMRYMADLSVTNRLAKELSILSREDPVGLKILNQRLNDLRGVQGPMGQWQNRLADQILAPMIGTNSASKIVQITNTMQHAWQLGMGKISYPLVNAVTFPQTVFPEAVMIMNAMPEDLAGKYTYFAAGGTKGPVGAIGILDRMKFMVDTFKAYASSADPMLNRLMERGIHNRVMHAQVVEDYFGEAALKAGDLRKAFSSGGDFVSWLRALSDWLPSHSERFARGHAFVTGYKLAKDILRITDEDQIFLLAKEFTENTQYMYGAADRARVFTSPVGSSMGLFKTWMINYMHAMMEYTQQGMTRGNWGPLLWQTAGTMSTGGLAATPLYWIANGFSNAFSDKSLMENAYSMYGEEGGNALMYGLPTMLGGISLYNTVQTPASNPVRDASMLWSAATLDRLKYGSQAFGAAFDYWSATGEHPGRSQRVMEQMARAFAPVTVYRAMAAFEDNSIRALSTGQPMVQDLPFSQRFLYMFGLNPVELDRAMEVSNQLYTDQKKRRDQTVKLGKAYAEAMKERDSDMMRQVLRQAMVWGLDVSSVLQSGMTRNFQQQQDPIQRKYKPEDWMRYRHTLGIGQ